MEYKYNLRLIFFNMSLEESRKKKAEITFLCNVHPKTLERWADIRQNDFSDIPAQKLDIIANVLKTTPDKLKNYSSIKHLQNGNNHKLYA